MNTNFSKTLSFYAFVSECPQVLPLEFLSNVTLRIVWLSSKGTISGMGKLKNSGLLLLFPLSLISFHTTF